ncbi:hypothetical protein CEXT_495781 [Caerostris extrusa]|uniref:Uncharacterized protein n=1 Tax=Caerostris extrusa TaxID=172846 RepID=A0AAV4RYB1_CAEEX|nr:hypothetical protein CEXT_495781 [Caerostris extrusa]
MYQGMEQRYAFPYPEGLLNLPSTTFRLGYPHRFGTTPLLTQSVLLLTARERLSIPALPSSYCSLSPVPVISPLAAVISGRVRKLNSRA